MGPTAAPRAAARWRLRVAMWVMFCHFVVQYSL